MAAAAPNWAGITGWLAAPAVMFTEFLINEIPTLRTRPSFEIGVYMGKYLAAIHDATAASVVGYDLFAHGPLHLSKVEQQFDAIYGAARRISLHAINSNLLSPERIRKDIGAEHAGVISVDGSHEREDVINDLHLANEMLSHDGFIAFDDFLNPNCLGVNEAFYRVMLDPLLPRPDLAPFAYVTNKLFMCRTQAHSQFFDIAQSFIDKNIDLPWMLKIKQQRKQGIKITYDLVRHMIVRVNH